MIEWFRQLGRASGNLGRVARRNPVWAVQSLIFSPFRFAGHLVRVLVLMLAVAIVLILGSDALVWYLGLARYPLLHSLVLVLVWAAILVVPLRALFQPLILRYGGQQADDTHGSARFATDAEARDLTGDTGLLIGRDRKSGKLLRYPGSAHLLTIAPTRSGKGVYGQRAGTFLSNAGVLQVFGVNDQQSAQLVSDLLGQETVVFETMSRALDAEHSGITFGQQHVGRPLLTPDEVRTLSPDRQLLFLAGQRPVIAAKLRYYADREFTGRYDQA